MPATNPTRPPEVGQKVRWRFRNTGNSWKTAEVYRINDYEISFSIGENTVISMPLSKVEWEIDATVPD
jgi:hypothetical protein